MPGPIYVPGAKNTSRPGPPKPETKPWVAFPKITTPTTPTVPPDVLHAWRGFWHALGSNLPWYINHSRATRRAMNHFLRTHG